MSSAEVSKLDRLLAKFCEHCPVCRHARQKQQGLAYTFVRQVEAGLCPFCQAYERVHGRKAHEQQD